MKTPPAIDSRLQLAIVETVNVYLIALQAAGEGAKNVMLSKGETDGETPLHYAVRQAISMLNSYGYYLDRR